MRRRQGGYTMVELLITFALLAILAVIAMAATRSCRSAGPETTEAALEFAKNMGEVDAKATCVTHDTDGDGYVSCTIFRKDKGPLAVECAGGYTMNQGCRVVQTQILQQ